MDPKNVLLIAFADVNKVHVSHELEHLMAGNRLDYPTTKHQFTNPSGDV